MIKKITTLFFDIETSLLLAYLFSLGKQIIRHGQLVEGHKRPDIICISYAFDDGPVQTIDYGFEEQNSKKVLEQFIPILKKADIIIGKNNKRFDDKHLQSHLMWNNLEGMPDVFAKTDDLERQMRKHFYLPSQSLDYISEQLGLGGKVKMDFSDWVGIKEKTSLKAFKKMIFYNKKDVRDTRAVWNYCKKHFKPKDNFSIMLNDLCCTNCGSKNIRKDGSEIKGQSVYQKYYCKDHNGYAGSHPRSQLKPTKLGK